MSYAPDDVAARVRAQGDVADEQVVGDGLGCVSYLRALPILNGKVGVIGTCSGGRHAYLAACSGGNVDAVVDCWGGRIVMAPDALSDKYPVAPIDSPHPATGRQRRLEALRSGCRDPRAAA